MSPAHEAALTSHAPTGARLVALANALQPRERTTPKQQISHAERVCCDL